MDIVALFYDLDKFAVEFEPLWKQHLLSVGAMSDPALPGFFLTTRPTPGMVLCAQAGVATRPAPITALPNTHCVGVMLASPSAAIAVAANVFVVFPDCVGIDRPPFAPSASGRLKP